MSAGKFRICVAILIPAALVWAAESVRPAGTGPSYSETDIVNAASYVPGALSPYTLGTIFGENLAYCEQGRGLASEDVHGDKLPTVFPECGTRVLVNSIPASLLYASPKQVNFLVPAFFRPSGIEVQVVRNSRAGPAIIVKMAEVAPAIFQSLSEPGIAVALHADGTLVTGESPAGPGEEITVYATGLGPTMPKTAYGQVPRSLAQIEKIDAFRVLLAGRELDPGRVSYVGVVPGSPGVYQANFKLPDTLEDDPEIRFSLAGETSPEGLHLPFRTPKPPEAETSEPSETSSPQRISTPAR